MHFHVELHFTVSKECNFTNIECFNFNMLSFDMLVKISSNAESSGAGTLCTQNPSTSYGYTLHVHPNLDTFGHILDTQM